MKRCLICGLERAYEAFSKGDLICRKCVGKLHDHYEVDYSPPEKTSRIKACITLITAVRELAVEDGELEDWEAYWINSPEWARIWALAKIDDLRSF